MGSRNKFSPSATVVDSKQEAAVLVGEAFSMALSQASLAYPRTKSNSEMRDIRRQLEKGKSKSQCCKSKPRCMKCPTVMHRLRKQGAIQLDDHALRAALLKARKW